MYKSVGCIGITKHGQALHEGQEYGLHLHQGLRGDTVQLGQRLHRTGRVLGVESVHMETRYWTNHGILPLGPLGRDCPYETSPRAHRGQHFDHVQPGLD